MARPKINLTKKQLITNLEIEMLTYTKIRSAALRVPVSDIVEMALIEYNRYVLNTDNRSLHTLITTKTQTKRERVTLRITSCVLDDTKALAKKLGLRINDVIEMALSKYFNKVLACNKLDSEEIEVALKTPGIILKIKPGIFKNPWD